MVPGGKDHEVVSEKVIIYKNGHAVVNNTIKLPANKNVVYVEIPGSCIFGTLFVEGHNNQNILNYTIEKNVEEDGSDFATTYRELLKLNVGKKIQLSYNIQMGQAIQVRTEIVEVISADKGLILVGSEKRGVFTLKVDSIVEIASVSPDEEITYFKKCEKAIDRLKIQYESSEKDGTATMQYMTGNLLWIPAYKLHLEEEGKASLHLQVCLCNDSESLVARRLVCALNLPQMNYLGESEVVLNRTMKVRSLIDSINSKRYNRNASQNVNNSQGKNFKDVLQYELENIELPLNSKRTVPVFSENVRYEKVFDCLIGDETKIQKVYESVRLINSSHRPFTNGSVYISSNQSEFVSHNTLPFVGPKGDALIRTCEAHGVLVTCTKEIEKKSEVVIDKVHYDTSVFCTTIVAKNGRQSTISALIKYNFTGIYEADSNTCERKPQIETIPNLYNVHSPTNKCQWAFDIEPDQEIEFSIPFLYYKKVRKPKNKRRHRHYAYEEDYGEDEEVYDEEEEQE